MSDTMTATAALAPPTGSVPPQVRLSLIGGFELEIDGVLVDVQPAVRRLTALIALTPRGLSRDFAAFQLWPDKPEVRAKANLRSTVWRLNQLPAPVVNVSATQLRLAPEVWLDTRDEAAEDDSLASGHPFETLLVDLLPDWYDEWLEIERERFRQRRLACLDARAREALATGDSAGAIQLALAALAIDGTRESSHRLVVQAHLSEGNEWEAERERSRHRRCLHGCPA